MISFDDYDIDWRFIRVDAIVEALTKVAQRPQRLAHRLACDGHVVVGLPAQLPAIAQAKVPAQAQVGVGADAPLARHDVPDALRLQRLEPIVGVVPQREG